MGLGTRGRWDGGLWDAGTWDSDTWGRGTRGRRDAGTSGHKDVINKQHLNYALNLKFTIFGGQEKGDDERYTLFFYKNLFYKNVEAEIDPNFKNILRTFLRLRVD